MESLTAQQAKLLEFIRAEISEKSVAPSFQEMADFMSLKSKSGIHRLVQGLTQRGHLYMPFHGRRRMSLSAKVDLSGVSADELLAELKERGFAMSGARS